MLSISSMEDWNTPAAAPCHGSDRVTTFLMAVRSSERWAMLCASRNESLTGALRLERYLPLIWTPENRLSTRENADKSDRECNKSVRL